MKVLIEVLVYKIFPYLDNSEDILNTLILSKKIREYLKKAFGKVYKYKIFKLKEQYKDIDLFIRFLKKFRIKKLNMNENQHIKGKVFKYLKGIKYLNIEDCKISDIQNEDFKYLEGISELYMIDTHMRNIDSSILKYLKDIEILHIYFIVSDDEEVGKNLRYLKGIRELYIGDLFVDYMPDINISEEDLCYLKGIKILDVSYLNNSNIVKNIARSIKKLDKLIVRSDSNHFKNISDFDGLEIMDKLVVGFDCMYEDIEMHTMIKEKFGDKVTFEDWC